jgi:DNA invertase Pin-like site-specific DNA recombinase
VSDFVTRDGRDGTPLATLRGAGYIRVSDEGGRAGKDNFFSPIEQRDTIERFATGRSDLEIVEWVEAIDVSSKGGNNFRQPDFLALVDRIKRGELDAVVVPRFDRFGRDLKESLTMLDTIEKAGGSVISASETTSNDAAGRLARNAFLMFANYQLDRITEGWRKVHDHTHAKGVPHGARVPLGYVRGKDGRCEVHPVYGPLMTWAFEQRAAGAGMAELVRELQAKGMPLKSHHALRHMLRNRIYLGEVRTGSRPAVKDAHPALTTETAFAAAQRSRGRTPPTGDHLLTGLVRCGSCGRSMSYCVARSSYKCLRGGPGQEHTCPHGVSITAHRLEAFVEEEFKARVDDVLYEASLLTPDLADLWLAHAEAQEDVRAWMQNTAAQRANMELWQEELDRRATIERETAKALTSARAKSGLVDSVPSPETLLKIYDRGTNDVGTGARVPVDQRVSIEFLD